MTTRKQRMELMARASKRPKKTRPVRYFDAPIVPHEPESPMERLIPGERAQRRMMEIAERYGGVENIPSDMQGVIKKSARFSTRRR